MQAVQVWLDEYAESHQHHTNKLLHWICVPLIVFSVIGMLWSIPVPAGIATLSPLLNWGTLTIAAAVVYYFFLSVPLAIGMLAFAALFVLAALALATLPVPLWATSLAIFVLAWIGQFIGHHIEGRKPSFFKDVQFLLIGPIWLLSFIYRRLGIAY